MAGVGVRIEGGDLMVEEGFTLWYERRCYSLSKYGRSIFFGFGGGGFGLVSGT